MTSAVTSLLALDEAAALELVAAHGGRPFHARILRDEVLGKGNLDYAGMSALPERLREHLAQHVPVLCGREVARTRARDGTTKLLIAFPRPGARDATIETVHIPPSDPASGKGATLCVSTQVGCPLACSFCATGALGFQRNLSTAEIVDQVCRGRELLEGQRRITNVVFMGMGEPLLNLDAVLEAVRILVHPKALAMAPRRVTVSTVGVLPGIGPLLETAPVKLAVSLHATTDEVRDRLVPLNRRFPLAKLLGALRRLDRVNARHPVFFEYTLIDGINDGLEDARRLVTLLKGIPSKVNLIPLNPHAGSALRPSPEGVIDRFLRELAALGATVTLRRSRGSDIDAACGQLALRRSGELGRMPRLARGMAAPAAPPSADQAAAFGDRKATRRP